MPWHWWWHAGPWGWWWVFPIAFVLCLVVMIVMMTFFCRRMMGCGRHQPDERPMADEALAILRRRFAAGEISEEEYLAKKKILASEHDAHIPD